MRATISLTIDAKGDIVQTRTEVDVPIARDNADRAAFVRWRAGTCRWSGASSPRSRRRRLPVFDTRLSAETFAKTLQD
ncbi:MAG: hypothetical protein ACJ8E5_01330 [Xanthobacteraceae bacterium]